MSNRNEMIKKDKKNSKEKNSLQGEKKPDFSQKIIKNLELSSQSIDHITIEHNNTIKKNLLKDSLSIIEDTFKKRTTLDFILQMQSTSSTDPLTIIEVFTTFSENKESITDLGKYLQAKKNSFKAPLMISTKKTSTEVNITPELREISFILARSEKNKK